MSPKTKEQNTIIKEERRKQLQHVALRAFCILGFGATKIADIAQSADISHGLVYHYYKTKDEIFISLLQESYLMYEKMYEQLSEVEGKDEKQKLMSLLEDTLTRLDTDENYCLMMYFVLNIQLIKRGFEKTAYDKNKELTCEAKRKNRKSRLILQKALLDLFTAGVEKGLFLNVLPEELDGAFWSIINGITIKKMKAITRKKQFTMPSVNLIKRLFVKDGE